MAKLLGFSTEAEKTAAMKLKRQPFFKHIKIYKK